MSDDGNQNTSRVSRDAQTVMRFEANKKSALIAYILWFFLGALGIHRFYLKRNASALIILGLTILSAILSFVVIGPVVFLIVAIWLFVDIFLIPGMTRDYNNQLLDQLS